MPDASVIPLILLRAEQLCGKTINNGSSPLTAFCLKSTQNFGYWWKDGGISAQNRSKPLHIALLIGLKSLCFAVCYGFSRFLLRFTEFAPALQGFEVHDLSLD